MSPQPYQSPLPHPGRVIPKALIVIAFVVAVLNLMWDVFDQEAAPVRLRVSLAHAVKGVSGIEALRSGLILPSPLEAARAPRAHRMDLPLGSEHGALTYNARAFREADHLGDDLNGIGGGNSDLGEPVFAAADGLVVFAAPASEGWGKVVILQHREAGGQLYQTFYAHLDQIHVIVGDVIPRGHQLGTVGDANGKYLAHLHLEWRKTSALDTGSGYDPFALDREPAEATLRKMRHAADSLLNRSFTVLVKELKPDQRPEWKGTKGGFQMEEPEE